MQSFVIVSNDIWRYQKRMCFYSLQIQGKKRYSIYKYSFYDNILDALESLEYLRK